MSIPLRIDSRNAQDAVASLWEESLARVRAALETLQRRDGPGNDFLGWLDLPVSSGELLPALEACAQRLRSQADALVVVGIGGSYLGARAVIDALRPPFGEGMEIFYAGHHIDGAYLRALLRHLEGRDVCVNVISKSGTTTEPALAFRVLRAWMEQRYGAEEAARRIVATTDSSRGALLSLAKDSGYERFVIPDDVGGRFSVFTPVGLLPIAAAGIDIRALLAGAAAMRAVAFDPDPSANPALHYAALRDALNRSGRPVEVLASFTPALTQVAEWWKQLFGESEGKDGKGIFPAAVHNTTDLHSMGQYIQDGRRMLFETFLHAEFSGEDMVVPRIDADIDGLNFLAGTSFAEINRNALLGTALAHSSGDVPNSTITLERLDAEALGGLLYMFEIAVALGGYALGVNPFDQPGVEEYKRNMFALLDKPGFEEERARLLARLAGR